MTFSMTAPKNAASLALTPTQAAGLADAGTGSDEGSMTLSFELKRIGPLKEGKRSFHWVVNGVEQVVAVKDNAGKFVFEGPMAAAGNEKHIGSPMPGAVEKMLVKEGDVVSEGDVLCTISAMKMEVKVTASAAGTVAGIPAPMGTRVVEGALLIQMK
jgi:pyruvate carboxylase